ncbi:N-ras protein [Mortierella sp. GBAus27b]|nr:N-ras protein [Mortierella sp. GBAus27b]
MSRKLSIVVIGDGAVGKSALTLRFLRDQFHDEYDPTIDDSYCKHIEVDGQEYTLDINDTAGQQEYRGDWNDQFLRAGDGFICVYSVTSTSSLEQLIAFRDQIWRAKEGLHVPMVIVGNKRDKSDQGEREISTEVGARLAENSRALFIEASAKTGFNVDDIFIALVREIVKPREERRIAETTSVLPMLEKTPPTPVHECTHVTPATTSRKHRKKPKKTIRCCTIM